MLLETQVSAIPTWGFVPAPQQGPRYCEGFPAGFLSWYFPGCFGLLVHWWILGWDLKDVDALYEFNFHDQGWAVVTARVGVPYLCPGLREYWGINQIKASFGSFLPMYFLAAGSFDRQRGLSCTLGASHPDRRERMGEREVLGAAFSPKLQFPPAEVTPNCSQALFSQLGTKPWKNTEFFLFSKYPEVYLEEGKKELPFIKGWNQAAGTKTLLEGGSGHILRHFSLSFVVNSPPEQRPWSYTSVSS